MIKNQYKSKFIIMINKKYSPTRYPNKKSLKKMINSSELSKMALFFATRYNVFMSEGLSLQSLRKKHPRFIYHDYSWQLTGNVLEISFDFEIEPDIPLPTEVTICIL